MWTALTNCSKQITVHTKLKETDEGFVKLYEVVSIEFDQFKLKLLEKNGMVPVVTVQLDLSCDQLKKYGFEAEAETVA